MKKVSVIGAGTWGMSLALLLSDNGHDVTVWSALPEEIENLKKTHRQPNLPAVEFPESMHFTADPGEAMKDPACRIRVRDLLDREMRACVDLIRDNRPRMDRLVTALLNKNKLNAQEIEEALEL